MPKFRTVRFGELQYRDEDIIHLPEGLVGMPDLRNWLILDMGDDVPMKFFQSLDRGDFGFPVSEPYLFHDDYQIQINAAARNRMGNNSMDDLATLIITTVHAGGTKVTGNLVAPLVLDTETRRGVQLTQEDPNYGMRQEINYFKFGLAVKSDASDNEAAEAVGEGAEQDSVDLPTNPAETPAQKAEPAGVS